MIDISPHQNSSHPHRRRRRRLSAAAVAMSLGVVATGCQVDDQSDAAEPSALERAIAKDAATSTLAPSTTITVIDNEAVPVPEPTTSSAVPEVAASSESDRALDQAKAEVRETSVLVANATQDEPDPESLRASSSPV